MKKLIWILLLLLNGFVLIAFLSGEKQICAFVPQTLLNEIFFISILSFNFLFLFLNFQKIKKSIGKSILFFIGILGIIFCLVSIIFFFRELPFDGIKDIYLILVVITNLYILFESVELFFESTEEFLEGF